MEMYIWLLDRDAELLHENFDIPLENYADFSEEEDILTGGSERTGIVSKLEKDFTVGKVKFWEWESGKERVPFVRIDNNSAYPHGMILTPIDEVHIKYHRKGKTIDETTPLERVQLLSAPNNDFVRKVFVTYDLDSLVAKPREQDRHFLLYANEKAVFDGKIK